MRLQLFSGSAHLALAESIAESLGAKLGACETEEFPDGERHVQLCQSVRGDDVYIVQPTSPPADERLVELLLLADAARRAGAARITAVVPYLGYARQDRRSAGREPVALRVVADAIDASAIDRLVAVDVHTPSAEAFFSIPVEPITAVSLLARAVRERLDSAAVIVAPDFGAAKLAERYAHEIDPALPVATVHKTRVSGAEVRVTRVIGDVQHRAPVIIDDMITTGATIEAAADALLAAGCVPRITVIASHGLFVGPAFERLRRLPLAGVFVTDTVPSPDPVAFPLSHVSVAPMLADAIARLHEDRSLHDLILHR